MVSSLAQAIRNARVAVGWTQEALAARLRVKARAISRWEIDRSVPKSRRRAALVATISEVNPQAGAALASAFASAAKQRGRLVVVAASPPPATSPAPLDPKLAFELALFALAEELDVPPGRLRTGLVRWQKRCRDANVSFDAAQRMIEGWGEGAVTTGK
jgi:transcriptional regulator with XRE-family HTH domain